MNSKLWAFIRTVFLFLLLAPFLTFILLWLKGLPSFAQQHIPSVLFWVYSVTWIPALCSGVSLYYLITHLIRKTHYFHYPFDFGRSFSLGATAGTLFEAFFTWIYRIVAHRTFSDFWISGAMIAGCFTGAAVSIFIFWRASLLPRTK